MKYLSLCSLIESLIYFKQPIGLALQFAVLTYKAGGDLPPMDVPLILRGKYLKDPAVNQRLMVDIYLGEIRDGISYDEAIDIITHIRKKIVRQNIKDVQLQFYSEDDYGSSRCIRIKGKIRQTPKQVKATKTGREHLRKINRDRITYALAKEFKDFDKKFVELARFGMSYQELESFFNEVGIYRPSLKYYTEIPADFCPFRY